jgi:hypothetical protein
VTSDEWRIISLNIQSCAVLSVLTDDANVDTSLAQVNFSVAGYINTTSFPSLHAPLRALPLFVAKVNPK